MIILGSWLGWALDGYDLVLMLFVISSVSQLFFPAEDQKLSLLATFATYAITLVVRPLGGALFGIIGDKVGRKRAMIFTIVGFSIATFSTGLLPTWQIVGILAPMLLIILRFSQGLFAGGEWGSGAVISMESVPKSSRGVVSGFIQSGFPFGFLIASVTYWIVSVLYQSAAFTETGWRIMFFTGIIPSLLALVLRLKMNESEVWVEKLKQKSIEKTPLKKLVSGAHRKPFFMALIITTGLMYAYYASIGFMPTLLSDYVHLGRSEIAVMMTAATFSSIIGYVFSGWISQRIGRIKTIGIFSALTIVLAIPLMIGLYHTTSIFERIFYSSVLIMIATSGFGPMPAFLSEKFPTQIRNTSAGFVFNSGLIIGAWAPLVAIELASKINWAQPLVFGINLMIGGMIAIIGLKFNPETRDTDLRTMVS
ncbi:MAG: MFS transporter [Candidatus Nitrosotalea sp.]|nr:MFS transporter [Candidatus Nitrosotalea sp.]